MRVGIESILMAGHIVRSKGINKFGQIFLYRKLYLFEYHKIVAAIVNLVSLKNQRKKPLAHSCQVFKMHSDARYAPCPHIHIRHSQIPTQHFSAHLLLSSFRCPFLRYALILYLLHSRSRARGRRTYAFDSTTLCRAIEA